MTLDEIKDGVLQIMFYCTRYGLTDIPCCDCPVKPFCDAYDNLLLKESKNEESN